MDEDNSSMTATRKFGIRATDPVSSPVPAVEPPVFSVPSYTGFLTETDLFPESDLLNVGNTRPPQHLRHFVGSEIERTYLTYFAAGDMHAYRHGTRVRVEGSTTHPAQLELLLPLFGSYVKPIFEPIATPKGHYAIRATFDLSPSFDFLLSKPQELERPVLRDDGLFYSALSGFSDAESHVGLRKNDGKAYALYALSNRNHQLMNGFTRGLVSRGQNANLFALRHEKIQWQTEVNGQYALKLLPNLGFRHREKIAGKQIAMANDRKPWSVAGPLYLSHRARIRSERDALETIAAKRFSARGERRQRRKEIFTQKLESSFPLFAKGLTVQEVAGLLHCSIRTAYRRMEKFKNSEDSTRDQRIEA
jgi:hypothetical protein